MQDPQWSGSLVKFLSQPLAGSPSQFPRSAKQANPHTPPAEQVADAPGGTGQAFEQEPHVTGRERSASHPLALFRSQLPHPVSHWRPHAPPAHTPVAWAALGHRTPQVPQWFVVDSRSVSQPLLMTPSQLPQPASHTIPHVPFKQATVACGYVPVHAWLHPPQWAMFWLKSASHPLAAVPSQFPQPVWQLNPHVPLTQVAVACAGTGQTLPQVPQWLVLVDRFTSHPLLAVPSQLPNPALQVKPHVPLVQVVEALARDGQTLAQVPQWTGRERSASHPSARFPLQFAQPVVQEMPH